ncbi:hypothetical protein HDV05_006495 [Chytridiales sp. JEL 0842]|nr:hypothetical protein HDV05_006495 [Chytridiales sp. JEL 0842]
MHEPETKSKPSSASVHQSAQKRHFADPESSARQARMLREDLCEEQEGGTTYSVDFGRRKSNLPEPPMTKRHVRPKLDANANLAQYEASKTPTQAEVDKFLYVSLYQATFDHNNIANFKSMESKPTPPSTKITSLYQETYNDPRNLPDEMKLVESRVIKNKRIEYPHQRKLVNELSSIMKSDRSTYVTSYSLDYTSNQPMVEAGIGPSFAETTHPLQTREIVKKAFKYRRH